MAKQAHPQPSSDAGWESILCDLHSPDDTTRARAVRQVCPCRMGWDAFQQSMGIVATLRKDPIPDVRRAALHVWEEAFELQSRGLPTSRRETRNEMAARKRRARWPSEGEDEQAARRLDKEASLRKRRSTR